MTFDHVGNVFHDQIPLWGRMILFAPGGLTFPIMAFLLTEGYTHTRDVKKYGQRLLIFAIVAFVPFAWGVFHALNILFTLFFGLIVIYLYDHMTKRVGFWFIFIGITLLSMFCDWGIMGVPMILCYHTIKNPVRRVVVPLFFIWIFTIIDVVMSVVTMPDIDLLAMIPNILYAFVGSTATIPLLLNYNGARGRSMKYFFYTYYPAHLLVLAILRGLIFGIWWQ
jgi:hypothetical protein